MGSTFKFDVLALQADQLGDPKACLEGEVQQGGARKAMSAAAKLKALGKKPQ